MAMDWTRLKAILDQHERYLLTCHVRPDCDAIGSELAMAELLESLGKTVQIVNADPTPPRLAFIDPSKRIEILADDRLSEEQSAAEVIIVLDTGAWAQLGEMGEVIRQSPARRVVIDHHSGRAELDAETFQDREAEATGRLIYELAMALDLPITESMAMPLFAALATDTGWFRFPSTKSSTYQVAAALIDAGALPNEIFRQLYEQDSLARAKLRSTVLAHISLELEGRLAHTYLLGQDFDETGALLSETEDFINMAMMIAGTEVAMMLTEQGSQRFKLSLRSRSEFDCNKVAALFGGGGHQKAAGATLEGDFSKVQTKVLDAVTAVMAN